MPISGSSTSNSFASPSIDDDTARSSQYTSSMMQSPFAVGANLSPIKGRMSDVSSSILASPQFDIHVHSSSGSIVNGSGTKQHAIHVNNNADNNTAELSADGKYIATAYYPIT
jgi:hypothetical protein